MGVWHWQLAVAVVVMGGGQVVAGINQPGARAETQVKP
jgi:hypothetical protein